ncbi:MAG: MATE family efflux transporter [Gammaproteobacteria bacterium]|nr:MATE family efflux transporter [Gammaproteobacteria bacterium]
MTITKTTVSTIFTEAKKSLSLAVPLLFSEWLYALNFFMIVWITAQLGSYALASMAIAQSIYIFLLMMISGISAAIAILVSQDLGAKNTDGIKFAFTHGILLNTILAVIISIVLWNAHYFLALFGVKDWQIIATAKIALRAFMWSLLPMTFLIMFEKFLIGLHRTRLVLFITIISIPISIFANYAFVLGKFGFPKLGLAGFGYGMAIAYGFLDILFILLVLIMPSLKIYRLFSGFKNLKTGFKYFTEIWRVGWPLGAMFSIEVGAILVFTFFISLFGADALAGFQLSRQYLVFALTSLFALTESAAVRVGHAAGESDHLLVGICFYVNIAIAFVFMLILSLVFIFARTHLIAIDLDIANLKNSNLFLYAQHFFIAIAIMILFDGIRCVAAGCLRGLKDTKSNMFSSILGFWIVGLPAAYLFGKVLNFGPDGLWAGFTFGIAISAMTLIWRFRALHKNIDLQKLLI